MGVGGFGVLPTEYGVAVAKHLFDVTLEALDVYLIVLGLVPGYGELADALSTGIAAYKGDRVGVALGAASMVPGAGGLAGLGRLGRKAGKFGRFLGSLGKNNDGARRAGRVGGSSGGGGKVSNKGGGSDDGDSGRPGDGSPGDDSDQSRGLFVIRDGVRRSKAADIVGNETVPARIARDGRPDEFVDVPINQLRSPKSNIPFDSRFRDGSLNPARAGSRPAPILVQPLNAEYPDLVPIPDITIGPP